MSPAEAPCERRYRPDVPGVCVSCFHLVAHHGVEEEHDETEVAS